MNDHPPPMNQMTRLPPRLLRRIGRVLVIDDDPFVCQVVARQLSTLGLENVSISSGDEDTPRIINEDGPFGVILCDLSMPRFDGIQLTRLIAARHPRTAMLYISASGHKLLNVARDLAVARGLPVLPPIEKPVETQALQRSLMALNAATEILTPQSPHAEQPSVPALREAIERAEIRCFVQPQLCAQDGALLGAEALARWNSPTYGDVSPAVFVPAAESHGLALPLTELILRQALAACAQWRRQGLDTRISVNVPAPLMADLSLPDRVISQLEAHTLRPEQLTLEVTETGVMQDIDRALDVMARLRLHGIGLAIDDFGCGHSTFQQLRRMPFSELKVDSSFVINMFSDHDAASIVRSSVALASDLGMLSVAEGVESEAHWEALRELGCQALQGFVISRAFPAEQLPEWERTTATALRTRMGFGPAAR